MLERKYLISNHKPLNSAPYNPHLIPSHLSEEHQNIFAQFPMAYDCRHTNYKFIFWWTITWLLLLSSALILRGASGVEVVNYSDFGRKSNARASIFFGHTIFTLLNFNIFLRKDHEFLWKSERTDLQAFVELTSPGQIILRLDVGLLHIVEVFSPSFGAKRWWLRLSSSPN
jgi:hypothetical protein